MSSDKNNIDVGLAPAPPGGAQSADDLLLLRNGEDSDGRPATEVFQLAIASAMAALAKSLPTTPQGAGVAWVNGGFLCFGPATLPIGGGGGGDGGATNHVLLRDGSSRVLLRDNSFLTFR